MTGPETSESIRATFGGLVPAGSPLARRLLELDRPLRVDLTDESVESGWAPRVRALGLSTLWSTPLWFADRRIGALTLLWSSDPQFSFDTTQVEQMGRYAGLAIGNADLRAAMRRDAELKSTLEGMARVGGVVLSQMAEAIVTTDNRGVVTAVNPAAERMYGFRADEAVGRHVDAVIEQLELDGSERGPAMVETVRANGYWQARVIQRPLVGNNIGRSHVVDLSITLLRNERRERAGTVGIAREVAPDSHLDLDAAALSSLAVATGRARTGSEVAESALERLCEGTMADFGMIVLRSPDGQNRHVEASRGCSDELVEAIRSAELPVGVAALDQTGGIYGLESLARWIDGTTVSTVLRRSGVAAGFIVNLRASDQPLGFLALGSRRAAWARPRDEVVLQISALIADALQNAALMERLEQGLAQEKKLTTQLETLMGLTLLPYGDVNEESVAQVLLERVVGAIGASAGVVVREEHDHLRVVASLQMPPPCARSWSRGPPPHTTSGAS